MDNEPLCNFCVVLGGVSWITFMFLSCSSDFLFLLVLDVFVALVCVLAMLEVIPISFEIAV